MGFIEQEWATGVSRRNALLALGGMLAGSPKILAGQLDPRHIRDHRRSPGINEMTDVFDFEPICYSNIPRVLYDFTAHSTDTEWTARRNRHAFDWVELVERPGVAAGAVDASTEVLGIPMNFPIFLSPTASQRQLHPTAEIGMYQAATANGTLMAVSNNSTTPQDELAAAATGPRWIQLYPNQNPATSRATLERYVAAGPKAIIFTVDQQATRFDRQQNNRSLGGNVPQTGAVGGAGGAQDRPLVTLLSGPPRYGMGTPGRLWYNWDFMEELRQTVPIPVIIKGILTAEDARISIDRGFDAIIVSNHGGRSLDYSPSSLEVLEEIVTEVDGRVPVLIDSGFRRGSDVFKALALGADAVGLGRASRWGLGAFGAAGVQRVLEIMQTELRDAMARTGRATLASIDRTAVRTDFP